jgi:predicted RNase H-like HicB family nuclease
MFNLHETINGLKIESSNKMGPQYLKSVVLSIGEDIRALDQLPAYSNGKTIIPGKDPVWVICQSTSEQLEIVETHLSWCHLLKRWVPDVENCVRQTFFETHAEAIQEIKKVIDGLNRIKELSEHLPTYVDSFRRIIPFKDTVYFVDTDGEVLQDHLIYKNGKWQPSRTEGPTLFYTTYEAAKKHGE